MNSGANIAVDPSSAFISAASQKDPLTFHQGVNSANTATTMSHSTIVECFIYITCYYLSFIFLGRRCFGQIQFMQKWQISRATAMDIACKTISGGFAIFSTVFGIIILWTSAQYTPSREDKASFFLDRVMVWAMSYFLYDIFAMYTVYLARNDAKVIETQYMNSNGSEPTELEKRMIIARGNSHNVNGHCDSSSVLSKELLTTFTKKGNDNEVSSSNKHLRNECDKSRDTFTDDLNGVSMSVVINNQKSFRTYIEDNPLIFAHHALIGLVLIPMMSLKYSRHEPGDMMIAAALIMEASTPFVSFRSVLSQLHGMRHSRTYIINGVAMVIAFFTCRILIYPIFYTAYGIQRNITMFQAILRTPWHCSLWMIMTLMPQLYWFRIMFIGALKVVREDKMCSSSTSDIRNTADSELYLTKSANKERFHKKEKKQ